MAGTTTNSRRTWAAWTTSSATATRCVRVWGWRIILNRRDEEASMNEQLKSALKQEDTIIFVGSGISCWSGLPSWTGLLNELADLLQKSGRDAELVRKE